MARTLVKEFNIDTNNANIAANSADISSIQIKNDSQDAEIAKKDVKNLIINGGMDIWQRATSTTNVGAGIRTVDRHSCYSASGSVGSIIRSGLRLAPNTNYNVLYNLTNTTFDAGTGRGNRWLHNIEGQFLSGYQNKTMTFSFYYRADVHDQVEIIMSSADAADNFGAVTVFDTQVVNLTADLIARRYDIQVTLPANADNGVQIAMFFTDQDQGSAGGASEMRLAGMMFHEGTEPIPFNRMGGDINGEFKLCQRYFTYLGKGTQCSVVSTGAPAIFFVSERYEVPMRIPPAISANPNLGSTFLLRRTGSNYLTCTTSTIGVSSFNGSNLGSHFRLTCTVTAGSFAGQDLIDLHENNGVLWLDAEL
jgi:hypothetical protein